MTAAIIQKQPALMNIYLTLDELTAWRVRIRGRKLTPTQKLIAQSGGQHRTVRKGRGMEFAEARPYQPGDEVRHMDWKVTARTLKPHTKVFTESHERPTLLLIDQTAATFFASRIQLKASLILHLAAIIGWTVLRQQDRIGGLVFNDHNHLWIPPQRSETNLLSLFHQALRLHQALNAPGGLNPTAWLAAINETARLTKPGGKMFLLGDLRALNSHALERIAQLRRHQDIIALNVFDPLEASLPDIGNVRIRKEERVISLDTRDPRQRQAFAQAFLSQWQPVRQRLLGLKIPVFSFATIDDPLTRLQQDGIIR